MYKFSFKNRVELSSPQNLANGLFLWIWQPTKLPPHLGVSMDGTYYSLLFDRKQVGLSITSQLDIIHRKKLSMIWQEVTLDSLDFTAVFEKYTSCSHDHCSCIQPIFDGLDLKISGGVLFDLLDELTEKKGLGRAYYLNLTEKFKGIKKYNRKEVEMHLFKLQA
jgi:hypothetical protein